MSQAPPPPPPPPLPVPIDSNSSSRTNSNHSLGLLPYHDDIHKSYYPYGTAGFREYATELHPIMIRIGLAMAVVSHHYMLRYDNCYNDDAAEEDDATAMIQQQQQQQQRLPSLHLGIMITASHNTYDYNGVKCIDVDGGMISSPVGETILTTIVNARDNDTTTVLEYIQQLLQPLTVVPSTTSTTTITHNRMYQPPTIHIGYDTRSHSTEFAELVIQGIQLLQSSQFISPLLSSSAAAAAIAASVGCTVQNHGIVTTPMLHHIVKHANGSRGYYHHLPSIIGSPPFLYTSGYYHVLVHAYQSFLQTKLSEGESSSVAAANRNPQQQQQQQQQQTLHVDCACGVGYIHLRAILRLLQDSTLTFTTTTTASRNDSSPSPSSPTIIVAHNAPPLSSTAATTTMTKQQFQQRQERLNEQCGSEYVQKQQCSCKWYNDVDDDDNDDENHNIITNDTDTSYCASLDGDGDRIVFFSFPNNDKRFLLLDGDSMACLVCTFIQNEMQVVNDYCSSNKSNNTSQTTIPTIRLGVVQTAYANGASTLFLQQQPGISVMMAKTGVKYVHQAAHDNYDVGIYFESNGHGTVIFNDAYYHYLHAIEHVLYPPQQLPPPRRPTPEVCCAYQRLKILPSLINQAVGDAISDLLLIDAILYIKNWTLQDWYESLYTNLPSRQMKVKVLDRTIIETNDNETQCLSPTSVQPALDAIMQQHMSEQARMFVRPSGTEDVVRVYAEATTQEMADELAQAAIAIVQEFCGGL